MCRLCHQHIERITHLAECRCMRPIWNKFRSLHKIRTTDSSEHCKLVLLGYSTPELLPAISDFHLILWKFIIIHFTLVDIDNRPFKPDEVWTGATRRYLSKVNSLRQKVRWEMSASEARERPARLRQFNHLLHPLATINESGDVRWNSTMAPYAAALCPGGGGQDGP